MSSIPISAKEIADTRRLADLITEIEKKQNDFEFANKVTDEIYHHQPFLLSTMMGYKMELPPVALNPLVKLHILMWQYFKEEPNVRKVAITQQQYERAEDLQIAMLQKLERLASLQQKDTLITDDLTRASSKSLLAIIFAEFRESKALKNLDSQTRGILLVGLKSFIHCFEAIIAGSQNK